MKNIFRWNYFLSKELSFLTSIFWQISLQTKLINNFRFVIRNKIHDRQPSKILDQEIYSPVDEVPRLTKKGNTWYIHNILKAVGTTT